MTIDSHAGQTRKPPAIFRRPDLLFILLILIPSIGVGLSSLRYGLMDPTLAPPGIREVMIAAPASFAMHALASATALILGPFQFLTGLRRSRPRLHRWTGRGYVLACITGGFGALLLTPIASGGLVASLGFGLLAVFWILAAVGGWAAAWRGDFAAHRRLMLYSFAMTFAAVTLRLQIPFGIGVLGYPGYSEVSPVLAFSSWLPNVAFVWWWLRREAMRRAGGLPAAV